MEDILKEVEDFLKIKITKTKNLKGTTNSTILLLNDQYVLKIDDPMYIKETISFLENCKSSAFTKLLYSNKEKNFIVYQYLEGKTYPSFENIDVYQLLKDLYKITQSYPKSNEKYGHLTYKFDTWTEFLKDDISYCKEQITCLDDIDYQLINLEINNLNRFEFDKVLMHGDFGTHNFIFSNNKLVGIIDPQPIVGDSLYDFFFACVSDTKILKAVTLDQIFSIPNAPKSKMKSMFLIVLYNRIQRCLKYHPSDLDYYLNLFNTIKQEEYHYYINNFI